MKLFGIMLIGASLILASCGKAPGPKGDPGPQGPAGPQGHREFKDTRCAGSTWAQGPRDRKALPAKRERRATKAIKGIKAIRVILERVTKAIGAKKATKASQETRSARYKLTVK